MRLKNTTCEHPERHQGPLADIACQDCIPPRLSSAAAVLGRKGGRSRSPRKVAAVRENGTKGGRPLTVTGALRMAKRVHDRAYKNLGVGSHLTQTLGYIRKELEYQAASGDHLATLTADHLALLRSEMAWTRR